MNLYAILAKVGTYLAKFALIAALAFYLNHLGYKQGVADSAVKTEVVKTAAAETRTAVLATNVTDTAKRDAATIAKLERSRAQFAALNESLTERLAEQERTPYKPSENPNEQKPPLLGQSVLDDGTVSLLNNARRGYSDPEPGSSPERVHAEGGAFAATAPFVTGRELAENDLEVVRKYHKLATRHDDLVDWVNVQCSRPAAPKK